MPQSNRFVLQYIHLWYLRSTNPRSQKDVITAIELPYARLPVHPKFTATVAEYIKDIPTPAKITPKALPDTLPHGTEIRNSPVNLINKNMNHKRLPVYLLRYLNK